MSLGSRVIRTLLAASTLHLMLAVPARACPMDQRAATAPAAQMAAPMSHDGHQMASMPAHHQAPAPAQPDGHGKSQMPCCPTPVTGCQAGACSVPTVATLVVVATESPVAVIGAPVGLNALRWVSFTHAPEPPPPRA